MSLLASLARCFVLGTHIQIFIGINLDGDFNLEQLELGQQVVVHRYGLHALES